MAQHDYIIANQSGAAFRADLNNGLAAIVSQNSGAAQPSTTYAYQWWADTTTGLLKIRNAANNAWITLFQLDGEWTTLALENGTAAAPSLYFKDSGTDTGLFSPGTNQLGIATNGVERARIDSSGNVGIGTTSPGAALNIGADGDFWLASSVTTAEEKNLISWRIEDGSEGARISAYREAITNAPHSIAFATRTTGGTVTEKARIDSSGRLLVGTSTSLDTSYGTTGGFLQVTNTPLPVIFAAYSNDIYGGRLDFVKSRSTTVNGKTIVQNNDALGGIIWGGADGTNIIPAATLAAVVDGTPGLNDMPGRLVFSTTADGASSPTERMRISANGNVSFYDGATNVAAFEIASSSGGFGSAAARILGVSRNTSTLRSINADGTINASGADYAEYMVKAGNFTIAKGDVCGVTADGQLTNEFADAVSFVVKSTNPSYVGGDTWGSEDAVGPKPDAEDADALAQWEADLEAARQLVDRIAFAGQVPVNVMGAIPGQYIVPVEAADGGIEGVAKDEADLTLVEYMRAVGKVIAIEDDGRARIIVKVA